MLEGIIVAIIASGLGITLTFIFSRNREASGLAHEAIASTKAYFGIIETLKTISFLQSQRIDQWEDWGRESSQALRIWHRYIKENHSDCPDLPLMPEMPELHLDLRPYWKEIDRAIESETVTNLRRK